MKNKNIWLLPTDKPSRLCINGRNQMHIYINNNEKAKDGDWYIRLFDNTIYKASKHTDHKHYKCEKIMLTTDPQLIKDGVQAIDDEFLEWFVKNPSCDFVEAVRDSKQSINSRGFIHILWLDYKIIIPKEEPKKVWEQIIEDCGGKEEFMKSAGLLPKQETLEEASKRAVKSGLFKDKTLFIAGAKWQQEQDKNKYSEEDMQEYAEFCIRCYNEGLPCIVAKDWFEQFKKK
jgi:hypothetical protein